MRVTFQRARDYATEILAAFGRHAGSQFSAAIAYRVLFSLVPFVALLLTILDAFLPSSRREQFVDWLFGELRRTESGRRSTDAAGSGASAP